MTPKQAKEARLLQEEIQRLQGRCDLTIEVMKQHQSSVLALIQQNASEELVEEHRNKATFYYESFLDLTIHIGRLTRKLTELTKKT